MKKNYLLFMAVVSTTICMAQTTAFRQLQSPSLTKATKRQMVEPVKIQQHEIKTLDNANFVAMPAQDRQTVLSANQIRRAQAADFAVFYGRPDGTLYEGIMSNFGYWPFVQLYAPAEITIPFIPYATESGATFSWTTGDFDLSGSTAPSGILNWYNNILPLDYSYSLPKLKGMKNGQTATYQLGENASTRADLLAGSPELAPMTLVNINNNEPTSGNFYSGFSNGDSFGPNYSLNGVPCEGLVTVIDTITSPLYAESVDVFVAAPNGSSKMMPANGQLIMEVWYLSTTGKDDELIAKATATMADFVEYKDNGTPSGLGYFHFTFKEEEDGFITELPLILGTKAPIGVLIYGFDTTWNMKFMMGINNWIGSAYTLHNGQWSTFGYSDAPDIPRCDLHLNFNGIFNCLSADPVSSKIEFPAEGGEGFYIYEGEKYTDIGVYSSFNLTEESNDVWIEEAPDWVTGFGLSNQYFEYVGPTQPHNMLLFFVEAAPLGTDQTGRNGKIVFGSYGITTTVYVKQGKADFPPVGISTPNTAVEVTKAARQGDNFLLSYPASATSVSVYNVAGQHIGSYKLNASGQTTVPAGDWAKGVYILKFAGSNATVKVIK